MSHPSRYADASAILDDAVSMAPSELLPILHLDYSSVLVRDCQSSMTDAKLIDCSLKYLSALYAHPTSIGSVSHSPTYCS